MEENVIEEVRKILIEACKSSRYFKEDYEVHTGVVEKLSLYLAEKFNANKLIVQLAAILHDIGRIRGNIENHEKYSAEEAEKVLSELKIEKEIIEKVKECILQHRHQDPKIPESLEAKILKIADAWSHFKKPLEILGFRIRMTERIEESIKWMKNKLKRDLDFLMKIEDLDIKEIINECKKKYESFLVLLD